MKTISTYTREELEAAVLCLMKEEMKRNGDKNVDWLTTTNVLYNYQTGEAKLVK